jgi:signal transduction histidine kinase
VKNCEQLNSNQQLDLWQRVQRAALKERDLISYVREFVSIESGKKELNLASIDLLKVLEASKFLFQDKLLEKELVLKEDLPTQVEVIAEQVSLTHSVINNIVSNAIKFSPRGKTIFINGKKTDDKTFCLSIVDQGIGIPAEILENLFSLSKKTSRPGTEGESGTGFGMPLVSTTMKAYGGRIEVESVENQGTNFRLYFRCAQ